MRNTEVHGKSTLDFSFCEVRFFLGVLNRSIKSILKKVLKVQL